ncbi:MAG: RNA polymerase sigma factor [Gammaproteobacteria bacterium]
MAARKPHFMDTLFRRYAREIHTFVQPRVGAQEAEDVVQEAYLRLLQHPNAETLQHPRAFLYKTAANLAVDHVRRDQRQARRLGSGVDLDAQGSPAPDPETIAEGAWAFERFVAVLAELPAPCQHAFILHKLEGLPYAEIAARLSFSALSKPHSRSRPRPSTLVSSACGGRADDCAGWSRCRSELVKKSTSLGISRSGGARNPWDSPLWGSRSVSIQAKRSCAPVECDFPSLATIYSQALSARERLREDRFPSRGKWRSSASG